MGWFSRNTKKAPPLVPGRDRTVMSGKTQPVYSYYAGRPISEKARSVPGQRTISAVKPTTQGRARRVSAYTVVVLVCAIVVVVCIVKLLAVTPNSKIIVAASSDYPVSQLATDAYARAANTLLRGSFLNRSKLTLNSNGIASSLQKQFPELTSVVVTVPLVGNRPVIYVDPSKPAFAVETAGGSYSMDAKGYILARLSSSPASLTVLKETSSRTPRPGTQYLSSSTVSFCSTVSYELKQAGIPVAYLNLPAAAPYELDAYVSGKPFYIRFNIEDDAMQQSGAAVATLQQLGANTPGQYLDVRVSERVYYK